MVRQLHHEHGLQVRLFIDDLSVASKIISGIRDVDEQHFEGIEVVRWDECTVYERTADVVIETFACGLPAHYLAKMQTDAVWVNVDYLSAESWVSEFHGLYGKHQESNRKRHCYFPGFSERTGGLLREKTLITRRDAFLQSEDLQQQFWKTLSIESGANSLKVSLFTYPNAPVNALLQSLAKGEVNVSVFLPVNRYVSRHLLGHNDLVVGDCVREGALTLYILPFLSQDDYDKLLWACDINFVRGEDSWVRALWAGSPFVWQPYLQADNAHLVKLNAFLEMFYNESALKQTIAKLHEAWSTELFPTEIWQHYLANLVEIKASTQQSSNKVIHQNPLAEKLIDFCIKIAN